YTLMLLAAWLALADGAGSALPLPWRKLRWLFLLAAAPLAAVPWLYAGPLDEPGHLRGFTELMRWGGLASLPLGLLALQRVWSARGRDAESRRLRGAALCSMGLFAAGGILGFLIRG